MVKSFRNATLSSQIESAESHASGEIAFPLARSFGLIASRNANGSLRPVRERNHTVPSTYTRVTLQLFLDLYAGITISPLYLYAARATATVYLARVKQRSAAARSSNDS